MKLGQAAWENGVVFCRAGRGAGLEPGAPPRGGSRKECVRWDGNGSSPRACGGGDSYLQSYAAADPISFTSADGILRDA
jgi:hypothetical protein